MVSIPSDLRKNKETIIGNMDLRECICLFLGLLLAIGILYYIRVFFGYKRIVIAAFIAGIFVIPFLFIGFKRINGMKIDDYFKVFVNNKIIANSNRINICPYVEQKISKKKYEMLRHYRLVDKSELVRLRQYLIDKNVLILTEYIDYQDKQYVVFRLDGKELVLEQVRRNKEAIEKKKKEIKELINNEIKVAKKSKFNEVKATKEEVELFRQNKKGKLETLNSKLKKLKSEKHNLKIKRFNDFKEEVDIFEGMSDIKAERLRVIVSDNRKNDKFNGSDSFIIDLSNECSNDERKVYQLHLFEKARFRDYIKSLNNKVVFINADNKVDVYTYKDNDKEDILVDLNEIDKKSGIYQSTILGFDARNNYNHYRKINSLEEIL